MAALHGAGAVVHGGRALNRRWVFTRTRNARREYGAYFSAQAVGACINLGTFEIREMRYADSLGGDAASASRRATIGQSAGNNGNSRHSSAVTQRSGCPSRPLASPR